jgi:hypothetical protein
MSEQDQNKPNQTSIDQPDISQDSAGSVSDSASPETTTTQISEPTISGGDAFFHSPKSKTTLEGFSFWMKFLSIIGFIGASVYILYGVISLFLIAFSPFLIIAPVVFLGIGGGLAYLMVNLWSTANKASSLQHKSTQDDYNQTSMGIIDTIRKVIKYYIIGIGVLILSSLILFILAIGSYSAMTREIEKDFDVQINPRKPSLKLDNYEDEVNPNQDENVNIDFPSLIDNYNQ